MTSSTGKLNPVYAPLSWRMMQPYISATGVSRMTAADVAVNMQAKNYLPALLFLPDKTLRGEILVPREDCLAGRELNGISTWRICSLILEVLGG